MIGTIIKHYFKMKTFKTILLTLAVIFFFIACNPTHEYGEYYSGTLSVVTNDISLEEPCVEVSLGIYSNKKMDLTIYDVKFTETMPKINIRATDFIAKKTKNGYVLSLPKGGIIPFSCDAIYLKKIETLQQYQIKEFDGIITTTPKEFRFTMLCGEHKVVFEGCTYTIK